MPYIIKRDALKVVHYVFDIHGTKIRTVPSLSAILCARLFYTSLEPFTILRCVAKGCLQSDFKGQRWESATVLLRHTALLLM